MRLTNNFTLAELTKSHYIFESLSFDQVILEFHNPEELNSGWVHVSYVNHENNRHSYLLAEKDENGKVRYTKWQ